MKQIKSKIEQKCISLGFSLDKNGRVQEPEKNLIYPFENWLEIKRQIGKGQGSELTENKNHKPKFCSVYSSSSLCVNHFGLINEFSKDTDFLGFGVFSTIKFEEKLNTGISHPNIDVFLENEDTIIAVESKFLEILEAKLPNQKDKNGIGNLQKYLNRFDELNVTPKGFKEEIINHFIDVNEKYNLDIAQLIKHAIGLFNLKNKLSRPKKIILLYIYWLPENHNELELYEKHARELKDFSEKINQFIEFRAVTYSDFWEYYENTPYISNHINNLKKRYQLSV